MAHDCYDDCIAYLDDQLGRLLRELGRRQLLAATDVIIASDHGEAFAEHGVLGHAFSVHVEEVGVPLVILSPGTPAGRVVPRPVSLRDLPATVVDLVGLSEGSPFPGRSLAADWGPAPGTVPSGITTPAFSEQADSTAFRPRTGSGETVSRYEMSIVSSNFHYIRDALGREQLYDLAGDPGERANLIASAGRKELVAGLRAALLELLAENPGSAEVERAYLERYRESLEAQVREATPAATTWREASRD
jgi:arylsulfatase A-like enzyme